MSNRVDFRDPREFTYIFSPLYSAQPKKFQFLLEFFALLANLNKPIECYTLPSFEALELFLRKPKVKQEPEFDSTPIVELRLPTPVPASTQTATPSEDQDPQGSPPEMEGKRGRPRRT